MHRWSPPGPDDPYDLEQRFVEQQRLHAAGAIAEIKAGRKLGCWSWYMFPTAPFVLDGRERGSAQNRAYALRDRPGEHSGEEAARAFLQWRTEGELGLRGNYLAIVEAAVEQLEAGADPVDLLGSLDEPKFKSSVLLFERASRGLDSEVNAMTRRALLAMNEEVPDSADSADSCAAPPEQ